uniref:KASH domain-containing protein n=1 Tax=Ditylenchus dipsaci TaxID=166011 RepID=A0A915ECD9_9BILA
MKQSRKYIVTGEFPSSVDELLEKLDEFEKRLDAAIDEMEQMPSSHMADMAAAQEYDVDAAAEVFAAIFRDQRPRDVLREHGFDDIDVDSSDLSSCDQRSEFGTGTKLEVDTSHSANGADFLGLSPVPDDPTPSVETQGHYLRQRSRWRRILRTALPLQAMLVLLLGAACLVPHCDDDYCCHLLNNFARSFESQLEFPNGPPPF